MTANDNDERAGSLPLHDEIPSSIAAAGQPANSEATSIAVSVATDENTTMSYLSKKRKASSEIGGMLASKKSRQPFRSPFKVPPKLKSENTTASPLSSTSTPSNKAKIASLPKRTSVSTSTPTKTPISHLAKGSAVNSAFRSPLLKSAKPSSKPTASTPISLGIELRALEQRAVTLRNALKIKANNQAYLDREADPKSSSLKASSSSSSNDDADARLEELCEKWKDAGRMAADLLWEASGGADQMQSSAGGAGMNVNNSFDSGFASSWGWADMSTGNTMQRTDSGGSSSLGNMSDLEEIEAACKSQIGAARIVARGDEPRRTTRSVLPSDAEDCVESWNKGKMLQMFGIDPLQLGWNEAEEDWQD